MIYKVNGKIIGEMIDGIFRKVVDPRIHKMHVFNAYAIEENIVNSIKKDCKEIRIKEKGTGTVFKISFKDIMDNSFVRQFPGYQPQRFITIKNLIKKDIRE